MAEAISATAEATAPINTTNWKHENGKKTVQDLINEIKNGESKMARELKVGDRVRCCDGSYIFGIRSGAFSTFISNVNGDRDDLRVIAVGLRILGV